MQGKKSTTDLSSGAIAPIIVSFTLPILLGQIFQNLYNSVDSIVVGRFVGTDALAAVTSSSDISILLVAFFSGLSVGAGVLFSRYFGAKDYKNLHDSIHTAITFSLIFGVIMAVVGILLTPPFLRLVSCPEEVFDDAQTYLRIYFIGVLFTSLYNVGSGVLRAVGNSRDPFIYLVISSVTNMVLDVLFVGAFKMGVMGVAVATIISQLLSVILVLINMMRTDDVYKLTLSDLHIDKKLMLQIVDLGFPAGIQSSIISISNLFVQRFVNLEGVAVISGFGAGKKVDKFVGMIANSFGLAASTFISQNMGAKRPERAFKGIRVSLLISVIVSLVLGIPLYLYADSVIKIFTDDPDTVYYGVSFLHTILPFYIFQILNSIYSNAVRGFGRSRAVMVYSILGMVVFRQIFLHIAMAVNGSVTCIFLAYPVGWFFASALVMAHYFITIKIPYRRSLKDTSKL